MRKRIFILSAVLISLILTGCGPGNILDSLDKANRFNNLREYNKRVGKKTPGQIAAELYPEVIECFKNRDKEKLKNFFTMNVLERYPLIDAEIEEAFDCIDGEIISCAKIFSDGHVGSGYTYASFFAESYILTDKGTEYEIRLSGRLHDVKNPKRIGISRIFLSNKNKVPPGRLSDLWEYWREYKEFFYILGDPD